MNKLFLILLLMFFGCSQNTQTPIYFTGYNTQTQLTPAEINFQSYVGTFPTYYGKIKSIADGDTFYIDFYSIKNQGIRCKGIDTPETKDRRKPIQYWGPEASAFAHERLKEGTIVRLEFEGDFTDPFGRLLAYVWYWNDAKQEWINYQEEMLESGNAYVYWEYKFEYPENYMAWQMLAIQSGVGMWSHPELIQNDYAKDLEDMKKKASWF